MKPSENEKICVISYEVARIRLGGGPESRLNFWKEYRAQLDYNLRTDYKNDRIRICRPELMKIDTKPTDNLFFRNGQLTVEKVLPT